ncbi:MAG: hypothetical protein A2007_02955 [Verrucomicrobia bacterium GWC2_42_7]|nr:MAG: hypothetical protein A2007_02955 [Verrucomicrobia bacterium GWC2_42_7]
MRTKFTIILFLLNLVIFCFIYQKNNNLRTNEETGAFFLPEIQDLNYMEISSEFTSQKRIFEKRRDHWEIVSPVSWPANDFAMQRIIGQIQFLPKEVYFSVESIQKSGQSLEDYGFNQQSLKFTYGNKFRQNTLLLGNPTKIGNRVYLLDPHSNNILVANKELRETLLADIENLRNEAVFIIPPFEARSVTVRIDQDNQTTLLEKQGDLWKFTAPIQADADGDRVAFLLSEFSKIQVSKFIEKPVDLSQYGLASPAMRITVQGNNRKQTLLVGSNVQESKERLVFAQLEANPSVFTIPAEMVDKLKSLQDLRDKRFLGFNAEALTSIEIAYHNESVILQKSEKGTWQVIGKNKKNEVSSYVADTNIVSELISELNAIRAVSFPNDAPSIEDLAKFGFNDPRRTIRIQADKEIIFDITGIDNSPQQELYVKLKSCPFVFAVDTQVLAAFKLNALYYRNRIVLQQPDNAKIESVCLTEIFSGKTIFEKSIANSKEGWDDILSSMPEEQNNGLCSLMSALLKVEAKDYIRTDYSDAFSLDRTTAVKWDYKLSFSVTNSPLDAKPTPIVIMLTKRLGGSTQFAGLPSQNVIFSLKQNLIDALAPFMK